MRHICAALLCTALAAPVSAQVGWGNLDQLLAQSLTTSMTMEASAWLPDQIDPAQATTAIGIAYEYIQGSAGSVSINAALFTKTQNGWTIAQPITGLFGSSPRDQTFFPDRVEVTMTTLGPNEPRCCPTQITRYAISRTTGAAQRLN